MKLAGKKTEALAKKIALVHSDDNKEVIPSATNPGDDDSDGDGYKDKFDPRPNINDIYVTKLSNDYIQIDYSTASEDNQLTDGWKNDTAESGMEHISYGGAQGWFRGLKNTFPYSIDNEHFADQGCGLIAMSDLILYLSRSNPDIFENSVTESVSVENPIDFNKYIRYVLKFNSLYVNLQNPLPASRLHLNNIDGSMDTKLNNYFKDNNINYRADMCIQDDFMRNNIWADRIKCLISKNIPAIICIGPSFKKDKVPLYSRSQSDIYKKAIYSKSSSVNNHYFTVTAVIEDMVMKDSDSYRGVMYEVSTWGKKYYMSEKEMSDFTDKYTSLFTNVMYISEK